MSLLPVRQVGVTLRSTILVVAVTILSAACSVAPVAENGSDDQPPPSDTALRAVVNGRSLVWSSTGAIFRLHESLGWSDLAILGGWRTGGSLEHIQVSLSDFHGVGVYVLDSNSHPYSGVGIYDIMDTLGHNQTSWWSAGRVADTAWVTAYDSTSGNIEGSFRYVGVNGSPDSVVVDSGVFKGTVVRQ